MKNKTFIAGLTGGSGSGKTYFLKRLLNHFENNEACFISQDDYYLPAGMLSAEENKQYNFDRPEAIDQKQFITDIQSLLAGKTVYKTTYTFNNPLSKPQLLEIRPAPLVIIEGIFILHVPEIAQLLNLKIFLDAPEETALQRRLERDKIERGYSRQDVLYKWERQVMPAYRKFLLPHRNTCDRIIVNDVNEGKVITETISELAAFMRKRIPKL